MAGRVVTRSKSIRKGRTYVCGNPFHFDWGFKEGGTRTNPVRSCLLAVLADLGGHPVASICRSWRAQADSKKEVIKHRLYAAVSFITLSDGDGRMVFDIFLRLSVFSLLIDQVIRCIRPQTHRWLMEEK